MIHQENDTDVNNNQHIDVENNVDENQGRKMIQLNTTIRNHKYLHFPDFQNPFQKCTSIKILAMPP